MSNQPPFAAADEANQEQADKPAFAPYAAPAGGWGALHATAKALREQSVELKGSRALLSMNQPEGLTAPAAPGPIRGIRAHSSFARMAPRPSPGN
jgi:hypothetical protein